MKKKAVVLISSVAAVSLLVVSTAAIQNDANGTSDYEDAEITALPVTSVYGISEDGPETTIADEYASNPSDFSEINKGMPELTTIGAEIPYDVPEGGPETTITDEYTSDPSDSSEINVGMPELTTVGVEIPGDVYSLDNVSFQNTNYTLQSSRSFTYTFNLKGDSSAPDYNRVNFVIKNVSGGSYAINLKNTTKNQTIVSAETHSGNHSFTLLANNSADSYWFSIVNYDSEPVTFDLIITSYYSAS